MADGKGSPAGDPDRQKMHSEQLVTLIIAADETSQAWLKFLVTVQGALAAGFGFLVLGDKITMMRLGLTLIICFFGIVLAIHLVRVIVRHHQWQAFFIKKHVAISATAVFPIPPNPEPTPTSVSEVEKGQIATTVERIGGGLVAAWLIAAGLVIFRLAKDYHAGTLPAW